MIDVAHIVLGVAEVREAGAAGALGTAPDDLDAQDVGAIDFIPHLDAELREVVAQQYGRVDARAPDRHAYSREGLAAPRCDLQDVARLHGVSVLAREQGRSQPLGVETADLLRVVRFEGCWGCCARRGEAGVDGEGHARDGFWVSVLFRV